MRFFSATVLTGLLIFSALSAVEEPAEPKMPAVPSPADDNSRDVRGEKEKQFLSLTVVFCDGREVEGNWKYSSKEITFSHTIDRINYSKTLKLSDLSRIRIESWQMEKNRTTPKGTSWKLAPHEVKIYTRGGQEYLRYGLSDNEWQKISIDNRYGTTVLYSYWIDFLYNDGKWHSGMKYRDDKPQKECLADVIREIRFE